MQCLLLSRYFCFVLYFCADRGGFRDKGEEQSFTEHNNVPVNKLHNRPFNSLKGHNENTGEIEFLTILAREETLARIKVIFGFNFSGLALICQTLYPPRFISHQRRSNTKIGRLLWHHSHFIRRETGNWEIVALSWRIKIYLGAIYDWLNFHWPSPPSNSAFHFNWHGYFKERQSGMQPCWRTELAAKYLQCWPTFLLRLTRFPPNRGCSISVLEASLKGLKAD